MRLFCPKDELRNAASACLSYDLRLVMGRWNFLDSAGGMEEEKDGIKDRLWMTTLLLDEDNRPLEEEEEEDDDVFGLEIMVLF